MISRTASLAGASSRPKLEATSSSRAAVAQDRERRTCRPLPRPTMASHEAAAGSVTPLSVDWMRNSHRNRGEPRLRRASARQAPHVRPRRLSPRDAVSVRVGSRCSSWEPCCWRQQVGDERTLYGSVRRQRWCFGCQALGPGSATGPRARGPYVRCRPRVGSFARRHHDGSRG
jgi:hypothetical protein